MKGVIVPSTLWPVIFLGVVLGLLEIGVRCGWIPSFIVPAPTQVWGAFMNESPVLFHAALDTGVSAGLALLLSSVIGITLALGFSLSKFLREALLPFAVFFQTVPIIAIAPVLILWFGFGRPTCVAAATIVAIFPIIANTLTGLDSTERSYADLFRLYGASTWQTYRYLKLRQALPSLITGLRIAAGLAVVGTLVGEFVAGGGLGNLIDSARTQQRLDLVFAAVLLSAGLGLLFLAVLDFISRIALARGAPSHSVANEYEA
jgi:NitT/TauT family transport system permease protein